MRINTLSSHNKGSILISVFQFDDFPPASFHRKFPRWIIPNDMVIYNLQLKRTLYYKAKIQGDLILPSSSLT